MHKLCQGVWLTPTFLSCARLERTQITTQLRLKDLVIELMSTTGETVCSLRVKNFIAFKKKKNQHFWRNMTRIQSLKLAITMSNIQKEIDIKKKENVTHRSQEKKQSVKINSEMTRYWNYQSGSLKKLL